MSQIWRSSPALVGGTQRANPGLMFVDAESRPALDAHDWRPAPDTDLSPQEQKVLALTRSGRSLKQIAMELCVSNTTICRVRQRGLEKLGFDNVCHFVQACAGGGVPGFDRSLRRHGRHASIRMTRAEREVAEHVLLGHSNSSIARSRGVSVHTVANQLASLFKKLRVQSRVELVLELTRPNNASPVLNHGI